MNISDLEKILKDRKKQVEKLERKRDKHARAIKEIDGDIAKLAGGDGSSRAGGGVGSRAHNDRPLPDYIFDALEKNGKPMKVGEIVDAVIALGYKSNSKSFKNIVNQMLIKERKRFAQIDRGIYGLAGKK